MDSPPELERIEVDTPPASPIPFANDSFDPQCIEEFVSPTKRRRVNSRFGQTKRRKKNTPQSSRRVPDEVVQQTCNDNEELAQASEAPANGYTAYVAAVSEQLAGFYPLSDELYVVQGWDNKSSHVKVSSGLIHQKTRLTNL